MTLLGEFIRKSNTSINRDFYDYGRFAFIVLRYLQDAFQVVQYTLFVGGPKGREQVLFGAVAGDPVDDRFRGQYTEALL